MPIMTESWINAKISRMNEIFSRNIMYWGEEAQKKLKTKHVFVFGLGGVGGYSAEALVRAGIGKITLIDFDEVSESNINRQIIALHSTIGKKKTEIFKERLLDINPELEITVFDDFYDENKNNMFFAVKPDYVIDAIDTQRAKIALLAYCHKNHIPVFSSMGAGNRTDPTKLFIADISEYHKVKCSFVKNLIHNLEKIEIKSGITCVFSSEKPKKPLTKTFGIIKTNNTEIKKYSPSSTPFVPPIAGFYLAYSVVDTIIKKVDK